MLPVLILLLALAAFLVCAFVGWGYLAWVTATGACLFGWFLSGIVSWPIFFGCLAGWLGLVFVFGRDDLRAWMVTRTVRRILGPMLPRMSDTEREALAAGTVWWDADLFSGQPDFAKLLNFQPDLPSEVEQQFLKGPVEELCRLADDWKITQSGDLSEQTWEHLRSERFLGLIVPEVFGGRGFSARAHSDIVAKVSSRSVTAAVSVMVPNSLGPAELLLHYGTEVQKKYWLPRLAKGQEIPCFALTGPENGSDAAGMLAHGVVCRGNWKGEDGVLGMRLSWDKRYTTLGPIATLLGLAFRLQDPDHLLGGTDDLGITVALVPTDLPGIEIGSRHDPLGVPFSNGPSRGRDVFVPLDAIIGGRERAGQGWRMLMDCLSAGRSISLPSLSAGAAQLCTRITSAYVSVRKQFGLPIGKFEGVQERLARIGGMTYLMDATRCLTAGAVDAGEKPSVISAICKAWLTEGMRVVVNDAMDVVAGAGISRGPRNTLARVYQATPIGITVEGANILTRSMIVFGQGALRCHPFVQEEVDAFAKGDLKRFDHAFWGHVNFVTTNVARSAFLGLAGRWRKVDVEGHALSKQVRTDLSDLERLSSAFALVADIAMATLGGELKRREMLSGRLADALAWMYLTSATLHRFVTEGEDKTDAPAARWATAHGLHEIEKALQGTIDNLPLGPLAGLLRRVVFPRGPLCRPPSDALCRDLANGLLDDRDLRRRLTRAIYIPDEDDPSLGRLEAALDAVVTAAPLEQKITTALAEGQLADIEGPRKTLLEAAVEAGVLSQAEAEVVCRADRLGQDVVAVDAFDQQAWADLRG